MDWLGNMKTIVTLILLFALVSNLVTAFHDNFPADENWECIQCDASTHSTETLYSLIRHALRHESREIYLNFDNSWMESILDSKTTTSVYFIPRDMLASTTFPAFDPPGRQSDERFRIAITLDSPSKGPLSQSDTESIDDFLANNPCWIPLHEPPLAIKGLELEATNLLSKSNSIYEYSTIFVRMPAFWLHSTCLLYTDITRRQFPKDCPTSEDAAQANWLGNIGWANCVHPLTEHFMDALHNSKLFLTPRAWDNGAATEITMVVNGKDIKVSGPWEAWADPIEECPRGIYAWNPWHCHFISLSKCNNAALHDVKFVEKRLPNPPLDKSEYLTNLVSVGLHCPAVFLKLQCDTFARDSVVLSCVFLLCTFQCPIFSFFSKISLIFCFFSSLNRKRSRAPETFMGTGLALGMSGSTPECWPLF